MDSELIAVITGEEQMAAVAAQCAALEAAAGGPPCYVLGEPAARNTGPAVALGARFVSQVSPDAAADDGAALLVLSSDHAIEPQQAFAGDVAAARRLARQGWLTTFGSTPTRPETGYGYLELGERLDGGYRVAAFREKPDRAAAARFVAAGGFLWNAGIFLFPLQLLTSELQRCAPEIAAPIAGLAMPAPAGAPAGAGIARPAMGAAISGAQRCSSLVSNCSGNRKMPAFQRNPPAATKRAAAARSGFSRNAATR